MELHLLQTLVALVEAVQTYLMQVQQALQGRVLLVVLDEMLMLQVVVEEVLVE
jgi:hypothetical protein